MPKQPNFIDAYLKYTEETEAPKCFHRWAIMSSLSAWLGRNFYLNFGHSRINPNLYVMLMGVAGTRKSSSIKIPVKLLKAAGYNSFSSSKTSKEKFLADLAAMHYDSEEEDDDLQLFDFSLQNDDSCAEVMVAADEFNNFCGNGNIEFLSLLGELWDFEGLYTHGKMTSKSIRVNNPLVTILSGNTPTGFSLAFPKEAIGQGIFSRLLLIHGDPTGRRITFPTAPSQEDTQALITCLQQIREVCQGPATIAPAAASLLDRIYQGHTPMQDPRFEAYDNRRFTQLLKLCLIVAAAHKRKEITSHDVVYANTMLTHAEHLMPKALGEFGMSSKSDVANKLMQLLNGTNKPLTKKELWAYLSNDMHGIQEFHTLLESLTLADKIFAVGNGFLAKARTIKERNDDDTVDFSLLSEQERYYIV